MSKQGYKKCFKCDKAENCESMCVDCCFDECMRIAARKKAEIDRPLETYEIDRHIFIANKSDWARLKKKYRGY